MSMHRELNPFLFGTASQTDRATPVDPGKPATGIMGKANDPNVAGTRPAYLPGDVRAIENQINALRVALIQMEKRTEGVSARIEELGRAVHTRLERFSQAISRIEENQAAQNQEATAKHAQLWAKVNERKVSDNKVQELIDRHNTIIRNFENRLMSLQRVVSEQEMALHNSQAALEEARAELLKRR